jgi:glycerophosphoryl diester phosphodiesterase
MRRELGTELPLVQLVSDDEAHDPLVTDAGLDAIVAYADGIGPSKRRIEDENGQPVPGGLVARAHARGLVVHPYTFRADAVPEAYDDVEAELRRFVVEYGVDGFFTDHPDRAVALFGGPQRVRPCTR